MDYMEHSPCFEQTLSVSRTAAGALDGRSGGGRSTSPGPHSVSGVQVRSVVAGSRGGWLAYSPAVQTCSCWHALSVELVGACASNDCSPGRRRDCCHFVGTPSLSLLVRPLKGEGAGVQQSGSARRLRSPQTATGSQTRSVLGVGGAASNSCPAHHPVGRQLRSLVAVGATLSCWPAEHAVVSKHPTSASSVAAVPMYC